jgi:hypothetical protein
LSPFNFPVQLPPFNFPFNFLGTADRVLLGDRKTGLYIVDVSAVVPEPAAATLCCAALTHLFVARRKKTRDQRLLERREASIAVAWKVAYKRCNFGRRNPGVCQWPAYLSTPCINSLAIATSAASGLID